MVVMMTAVDSLFHVSSLVTKTLSSGVSWTAQKKILSVEIPTRVESFFVEVHQRRKGSSNVYDENGILSLFL